MKEKAFTRAVSALPTLAPVLKWICSVIENPDSSSLDIAHALQLDPVVTGKVLHLANSAYIGMPRTISSVQNAVTILGAKRIHSLVLVSTLRSLQNVISLPFSIISFWRHSTSTALIAEAIAKSLRRYDHAIDESDIFTGALLHDIGKLIFGIMEPEILLEYHKQSIIRKVPFYLMEKGEFDHSFLGGLYAEHWGFPVQLKNCIGMHHNLASIAPGNLVISIIQISDIIAHIMGFKIFTEDITPEVHQEALTSIGLPLERLKVIAEKVIDDQKSIESLVDILGNDIL